MAHRSPMMFLCGLVLSVALTTSGNQVVPRCPQTDRSCVFSLSLNEHRMMTYARDTSDYTEAEDMSTFHGDGSARPGLWCDPRKNLTQLEASKIQTGDGSYKLAFLFNESLPGPPIVVYRGQEVIVHVTNLMDEEGTTVHWHGVTQFNTPYMDGVEGLSQCIINPGDTFTYRFEASDAGTFWYHSHTSTQRTMGAHGPLIVMDRNMEEQNQKRRDDPLPPMDKEFYMVVTDWFEKSSREMQEIVHNKAISFFHGWYLDFSECFNSTKAPDGLDAAVLPFQSALINGRGFHYNKLDGKPEIPGLPLEQFVVQKGKRYRFRMIGSAMAFMFRVSIDDHKLHVISTDGNDVVTRSVDYIIIASGERYDFWIEANDPADLGAYWIRAETYSTYTNTYQKIPSDHSEAILRYDDSAHLPVSLPHVCTSDRKCEVLNCPFEYYGKAPRNITCLPITELQGTTSKQSQKRESKKPIQEGRNFVEHFLNFHMMLEYTPGLDIKDLWTVTINGYRNQLFAVPAQVNPEAEKSQRVACDCPIHEVCPCNHVIEIPLGSVVQFVLFVTIKNPPGVLNGLPHNIHLHGYSFDVLKVGYANYDQDTGMFIEHTPDIECFGEYCNTMQWTNSSWSGGNVPDTVNRPPQKDTILVPIGGYAVVQFEANNPGFWYMHCHTEFHNEEGMSLVVKVGDTSEMAPTPSHMTQCADSDRLGDVGLLHSLDAILAAESSDEFVEMPCSERRLKYQVITGCLVFCSLILFALDMYCICKYQNKKQYVSI